jgi:hypothetical protein
VRDIKTLKLTWIASFAGIVANSAHSLPIGFGHNQGELDYFETKNEQFIVYHDKETSNEARSTLNSLTAAKPILEDWMMVQRDRPMPVVMSSIAAGASFANFITDAIELQTYGQGERDLYWHELTHSTMYRHLDNWLGPPGSILHLPWMPSWFIEGLPEALTVSVGSDLQAGYERFHALSGDWPTYDRLHSLYGGQSFSTQGYATAGGFVAYIFQTYGAAKLPQLLRQFYKNSMPWMWPWALVPFGPFLPMDDALEQMTGKDGRALYEEYKAAATKYWQEHTYGPFLYERPGKREEWSTGVAMWQSGSRVHYVANQDGDLQLRELIFNENKGWARSRVVGPFPDTDSIQYAKVNGGFLTLESAGYSGSRINGRNLIYVDRNGYEKNLAYIRGDATQLAVSKKRIVWIERHKEVTRLCFLDRSALTSAKRLRTRCVARITQPSLFTFLGTEFIDGDQEEPAAAEIWFAKHDQKLVGDTHTIFRWKIDSNEAPSGKRIDGLGRPKAVAFAGDEIWLQVAERTHHTLRKIDRDLNCIGVVPFADLVVESWGYPDRSVAVRLRAAQKDYVMRLSPDELQTRSCYAAAEHSSPLLVAMRGGGKVPIEAAVKTASLWTANLSEKIAGQEAQIQTAPALDQVNPALPPSEPARKRYRPVFGVPWMQSDALGYNFGILSVPLMDHMQNETLTLTALFGLVDKDGSGLHVGHYPSTELSLVSNRFWPTLKLDAFRSQAYDGSLSGQTSYADERGFRLTANIYHAWTDASYEIGIQSSFLRPYLGPLLRGGQHNMPFASISKGFATGSVSWSLSAEAKAAPKDINSNFDYNQLDLSVSANRTFDFLRSRLSMGLTTGRTRGSRTRNLREWYQPLRTYVPGSGGGFNNMMFGLEPLSMCFNPSFVTGPEAEAACPQSVFGSRFGENQVRFSANYTFPLIPDLEKLVRMFYVRSLEFGSFFNYGGAWSGHLLPESGPDGDLIPAIGANTDLLFELNGVKFNVGLGSGRVLTKQGNALFFIRIGFDSILQVNQN